MQERPTLLNSCAKAATAAEARFRISVRIESNRSAKVVALDERAAALVRRVAEQPWGGARFYLYDVRAPRATSNGDSSSHPAGNGTGAEIVLRGVDGSSSRLADALSGADVAVMIATADDGADGAAAIGVACSERGIMTAGLVLGAAGEVGAAVSALRPHARVLIVSSDESDVSEVLSALRA